MKKKLILASILTLIFAVSDLSAQQHRRWREGPPPPPEEGDPFFHRCFGDRQYLQDELNLTEAQIAEVARINTEYKKKHDELREKMVPKRYELRQLLLAEKINIESVRNKLREISDIEVELKIIQIQHRLALQKVLTPAQTKLLLKERREMKRHHRMRDLDD